MLVMDLYGTFHIIYERELLGNLKIIIKKLNYYKYK